MGLRSPSWIPSRNIRKDEVIEKPDLGWRAVGRRHQFLLSMLVVLTLVCSVYLYFAITFTSADKCTRLHGSQKSQCYEIGKKNGQIHGLERRQVLLRQAPYGDMTGEDSTEENVTHQEELPMKECGKEFEHYSPCRNGSFFPGVCRERDERPPMCRVPVPWDYQNPEVWNDDEAMTDLFPAEEKQIASIEFDFESTVGMQKVLTVGCHDWKISSFALMQERDDYTLSILGGNTSGLCAGFPALLLTLEDYHRFPAHSFDLIRSTECGDQWHLMDEEYLSSITRLLRPGGYFIGGCIVHNLKWSRDRKKLTLTSVARFADLNVHKTNMYGELNGLVNIAALTLFIFRSQIRWNVSSQAKWRVNYTSLDSSSEGRRTPKINETQVLAETLLDGSPDVHGVFAESSYIWKPKIAEYVELLGNKTFGEARNILDMNAGWGSFGAVVMKNYRVWVMNVVAPSDEESLDAIHTRGMVGIGHDWIEAFPTPPRSYDLVHASWIFSNFDQLVGPDMIDVLLEVDRILRPEGLFIIRDSVETVAHIKVFPSSLRWRVLHEYFEEYLDEDVKNEQVLILKKED